LHRNFHLFFHQERAVNQISICGNRLTHEGTVIVTAATAALALRVGQLLLLMDGVTLSRGHSPRLRLIEELLRHGDEMTSNIFTALDRGLQPSLRRSLQEAAAAFLERRREVETSERSASSRRQKRLMKAWNARLRDTQRRARPPKPRRPLGQRT
jgi:hypothetical protein